MSIEKTMAADVEEIRAAVRAGADRLRGGLDAQLQRLEALRTTANDAAINAAQQKLREMFEPRISAMEAQAVDGYTELMQSNLREVLADATPPTPSRN
jgi:hypothetical protein